jgi:hypothetical protein
MANHEHPSRNGCVDVNETLGVATPPLYSKRKASVLDEIGEPRPTSKFIPVDTLSSLIMDTLDGGNMVRITNGQINVKRKIFAEFSPVSGEEHLDFMSSPLVDSDYVDIVFTLPRALIERSGMISCVIHESMMTMTAFN